MSEGENQHLKLGWEVGLRYILLGVMNERIRCSDKKCTRSYYGNLGY